MKVFDNCHLESMLRDLSKWTYEMITDGDGDPKDAFEIMRTMGYIDENQEWIYDE